MEDPGGREETPPNIELEFRNFDEKDYTSEFYSFASQLSRIATSHWNKGSTVSTILSLAHENKGRWYGLLYSYCVLIH